MSNGRLAARGAEFDLEEAGDGGVFTLRCKPERLTAHIAGHDAIRFRADYAAIKEQFPAWSSDQMLARLRDQAATAGLPSRMRANP